MMGHDPEAWSETREFRVRKPFKLGFVFIEPNSPPSDLSPGETELNTTKAKFESRWWGWKCNVWKQTWIEISLLFFLHESNSLLCQWPLGPYDGPEWPMTKKIQVWFILTCESSWCWYLLLMFLGGLLQRGQQRAGGVTEGQGTPDDRSPSQQISWRVQGPYQL